MAKKILIVEDNDLNRRLFSDLLSNKGYQVFECAEGKSALSKAVEIKPDLILMDIQMPEVDGLTATKMIRNTPEIAKTKIIAVTAFAMDGDCDRILAGGCDGYISKPIAIANFLKTVEDMLAK